jgi:hypothetical protein
MYLSPMVTHDGNQGEEKCSGGRDIFNFAQVLQPFECSKLKLSLNSAQHIQFDIISK